MIQVGDIIIRTSNSYRNVPLGTRGRVIERRPLTPHPTASSVLILDGGNKGEHHTWSDSYVELDHPPINGTPDWEV